MFYTIGANGFHMSVLFPFRFLTPPLFIPWAQVESVTFERIGVVAPVDHAVVHIRGCSTKIMIPGEAGQRIANTYAHSSS